MELWDRKSDNSDGLKQNGDVAEKLRSDTIKRCKGEWWSSVKGTQKNEQNDFDSGITSCFDRSHPISQRHDSIVLILCKVRNQQNTMQGVPSSIFWSRAGPALASAGPDLKHFCGAPLSGVEKFLRGASRHNDRNRWCYEGEARKGDAKTSPVENSMDSAIKPNKSNNCNLL